MLEAECIHPLRDSRRVQRTTASLTQNVLSKGSESERIQSCAAFHIWLPAAGSTEALDRERDLVPDHAAQRAHERVICRWDGCDTERGYQSSFKLAWQSHLYPTQLGTSWRLRNVSAPYSRLVRCTYFALYLGFRGSVRKRYVRWGRGRFSEHRDH